MTMTVLTVVGVLVVVGAVVGGCWFLYRWFKGAADLP